MFHFCAVVVLLLSSMWVMVVRTAYAAGFESLEQSASTLANANAGTAVIDDPSIAFYNPAGISQFNGTVFSLSNILVQSHINFSPRLTTNFAGNLSEGEGDNPGDSNLIPAFYYIHPFTSQIRFGLAVNVPFGLSSTYGPESAARYFATYSSIKTININPSLAIAPNDRIAVGVGFNAQELKADLNQQYDYGSLNPGASDLSIINSGKSWAYGWNAGLWFTPEPSTRFGISYRSKLEHHVHGLSQVHGIGAGMVEQDEAGLFGLRASNVDVDIMLPETIRFSFSKEVTYRWQVLADVAYIRWSRLKQLVMHFSGNPEHVNPAYKHLPDYVTNLYYSNSWRFAIGQRYLIDKNLELRQGFAYDQSPVHEVYRTARIPDGDRYWYSLGLHVILHRLLSLDFAYAFVKIKKLDSHEHLTTPIGTAHLEGHYAGYAHLVGFQLNYVFA